MIARNVAREAIERAADSIGVRFGREGITPINQKGTAFRFVLRPIMPDRQPAREYGRWFRRGHDGKRTVAAVCWHGHREFFRTLFALAPDCKVQTRQTRELPGNKWYTADNFEHVYGATDTNIGSQMNPQMFSEACFCGDTILDRVTERLMQHSDDRSQFSVPTTWEDR